MSHKVLCPHGGLVQAAYRATTPALLGKKSALVNGKHYTIILQIKLMTLLGLWGLLFYSSLNHLVLFKLSYYTIHQMLSNKDTHTKKMVSCGTGEMAHW